MIKVRNLGKKSLEEVTQKLQSLVSACAGTKNERRRIGNSETKRNIKEGA